MGENGYASGRSHQRRRLTEGQAPPLDVSRPPSRQPLIEGLLDRRYDALPNQDRSHVRSTGAALTRFGLDLLATHGKAQLGSRDARRRFRSARPSRSSASCACSGPSQSSTK